MNLLDIFILLILLLVVWKGFKKGLIVSLFKLLGSLLGLLAAFMFCGALTKEIDSYFSLTDKIIPLFGSNSILPAGLGNTRIDSIPFSQVENLITKLSFPEAFQGIISKYINEIAEISGTKNIELLGDALVYLISTTILTLICFALIFFLVSYLIGVITKLLKKASFGPLGFIDHLGGAFIGLLGGLVIVGIGIGILIPFVVVGSIKGMYGTGLLPQIAQLYHDSVIVSEMSKFILTFFSR